MILPKRFLITLLLLSALSLSTKAQYDYKEAIDITVSYNGDRLEAPLTGGFNNVQLCEIDLDLDGTKDLVLYDRFQGQVRPYINAGISDSVSYRYAPEYSARFPELDQFLLTADYNNDGKMDLYIGGSSLDLYENTSNTADGLSFQFVKRITSAYNPGSTNTIGINPTSTNIPGIYDIDFDNDLDLFINQGSRTIDYHRNLSMDLNNDFNPVHERRSRCWGLFFEGANKTGTRIDSIYLDSCYSFFTRGERLKHGQGLTITALDYDGNSSTDLIVADDGAYKMKLLLNADSVAPYTESRMFKVLDSFPNYDVPVKMLFPASYIIDVNNDGKKDMLVSSNQMNNGTPPFSGDEILYYKNVATDGNFRFELQSKQFLRDETLDFGRISKPVFYDYNKDGLEDLLVGNGGYLSPENDSFFIGKLALLENVGTATTPSFELIDTNYLNIPSLNIQLLDNLFANVSPTLGDIDGDGDKDLLLTQNNGKVYLFEDTASSGVPAQFKFHPEPYQGLDDFLFRSSAGQLVDIDNNGLLDLLLNTSNRIKYFVNFGTATEPIFNIALDSIYWIGGDTMRYVFKDRPNFSLFSINDSVAVNQVRNTSVNSRIPQKIVAIDSVNNYIDCFNHINQGVGDDKYDEYNTDAHMTFFNNEWEILRSGLFISIENTFLYQSKGKNQLLLGAQNGNNYFLENFIDSIQPLDTIIGLRNDYLINYGQNSFVNGADINNDNIIDLAIGTNAGGIKILYGEEPVGIDDIYGRSNREEAFFQVYPNPAKGSFIVDVDDELRGFTGVLEIHDVAGKLILTTDINQDRTLINSEKISSGVYFVSIQKGALSTVQKLVVRP